VDTSFSLPGSLPSYRAGVDEAAFSSDTTIPAINNTDPVPTTDNPNGYYMVFGSGNLYMAAGTNANTASDTQADSLSVADGATLTLALNYDFNTDGDANESTGSDTARLDIQGDVQINGTLTVLPLNSANSPDSAYTPDSGAVEIEAINLFVGANGVVSTAGDDSATDHGGHGGQLRLEARNGPGNLLNIMGTIDASGGDALSSSGDGGIGAARLSGSGFIPGSSEGIHLESADGMVVVSGPVASSGGDGENGGGAGEIEVDGETFIFITADLMANGGVGSNGTGGDSYGFDIEGDQASIYISSSLMANGGDGLLGGGDGGDIDLDQDYPSEVILGGAISADGGNAMSNTGNGGDGGDFEMNYVYNGPLVIGGMISLSGGAGADTAGYLGGDGGDLDIYMDYTGDYENGEYLPVNNMEIAADIDLSGGDGDTGGDGGDIDIDSYGDSSELAIEQVDLGKVRLLGFDTIDISGGDAPGDAGGDAGDSDFYTEEWWALKPLESVPSITNEVMWMAVGGASANSGFTGGEGGYLDWDVEGEFYMDSKLINTGDIDVSGGSGDYGGASGGILLSSYHEINNSGNVTANGGDGRTSGGEGAYEYIEFEGSMDINNSGTITANGGEATDGDGGDGGDFIQMYAGFKTTNTGAIFADGGAADLSTTSASGGDGGDIELNSAYDPTSNSATLSVVGGDGGTPGDVGEITIDGVDWTPSSGML
jgi:hypothetical protein